MKNEVCLIEIKKKGWKVVTFVVCQSDRVKTPHTWVEALSIKF
jgi:hypothetical protein